MAAAGQDLPPDVEAAFAKQPGLKERLDEAAILALGQAETSRALQVIEDLATKSDVRNPSAFVASTLSKAPAPPASGSAASVQEMLQPHPQLLKALDEGAMRRLGEVELPRATEVIDELVKRPDVRNPSAFVVHSLGRSAGSPAPREDVLEAFPTVAARLDDRARVRVRDSDPVRAKEIMQEILNREDLQNPSAFVMKSLGYSQIRREDGGTTRTLTMQERDYLAATQVETLLSNYPNLRARLDNQAIRRMRESELTRVQEILQELDSRGDVRNPSAFVVRALADASTLKMPEPTPTLQAETLLSQQSLLAAQYMLAAQAQAQLIPHLGMPGLTSQLAASQVSGLTASQLAAQLTPQLTASQLTAPSLFLPPADPLQQMLALNPALVAQGDESRGRAEARTAMLSGFPMAPAALSLQAGDRSRSPRRDGWVGQGWR